MCSKFSPGAECGPADLPETEITAHPNRDTHLGPLPISRALPLRDRRMVGPWCFLDRFGPLGFADQKPMQVPPHPHIGLQTVSWLLEGEVLHRDSLGSEAILSAGGVNVMTSGKGITHAEETPSLNSGRLNGVQLWVALPDEHRGIHPSFTHLDQVPLIENRGGLVQLFAGSYYDVPSPAQYFSKILGMDVLVHPHGNITLELQPQFEHAVLLLEGDGVIEGLALAQKTLFILGPCRETLNIRSKGGGRVLLIGGPPFPEKILMWWNFVARTPDEIHQARDDWEAHRFFGDVPHTRLPRLSAPDLGRIARPNPAS